MDNYQFKLLMLGDSGVGKSSLLMRFCDDTFNENSTLAVDQKIRTVDLEGQTIKLGIWDTAGQERFKTITRTYYRNASGIVLVFDLTDAISFNNVKQWLQEIDRYAPVDVERVLLGNKSDLVNRRVVTSATAQEFADTHSLMFFETSAKSSTNVENSYNALVRQILKRAKGGPGGDNMTSTGFATPQQNNACKCG
eukprot:TRINITY_DN13337_c0_g1_i1.p1 TRINITY_DN13337_c0_g1~~TRINITY_DN13337_c0_g1_i1.p1  ORF type:complete len:195 (+),score=14.38 TRINITY_DN13337_c0_g1_i1:124-708(+)